MCLPTISHQTSLSCLLGGKDCRPWKSMSMVRVPVAACGPRRDSLFLSLACIVQLVHLHAPGPISITSLHCHVPMAEASSHVECMPITRASAATRAPVVGPKPCCLPCDMCIYNQPLPLYSCLQLAPSAKCVCIADSGHYWYLPRS